MVIRCLASPFLLAVSAVLFSKSYGDPQRTPEETPVSCGEGWYSFGDMCYKRFGQNRISRLSWEKASEACRNQHGGHLASIHSQELQDFLTTFLVLNARGHVWIGFNDRHKESDYKWDDGSAVDFTDWDPTEPNDNYKEHEDCIKMLYQPWSKNGKAGKWNDVNCGNTYQYICQKPKGIQKKVYPDPRLCTVRQGGGWKFESSCFHMISQPKSWYEAEEYCVKNHGGHLASITDFATDSFLAYVFQQRKHDAWIGIRTNPDTEQQSWSSGWFVSFENWAERDVPIGCSFFTPEGKWGHKSCRRELPFICEKSTVVPPVLKPGPADGSCPTEPKGWKDLGGDRCYFFDPEAVGTWPEANFICMRRGGTLASIHSIEEVKILHKFMRYSFTSSLVDGFYAVYIGLYRKEHDHEFAWADGSPVDFYNWAPGEDSSQHEQCVEVIRDTFLWNDIDCGQRRGFFCSVPKIRAHNTTKPGMALLSPDSMYRVCRKAVFGLDSKSNSDRRHPFLAGKLTVQDV